MKTVILPAGNPNKARAFTLVVVLAMVVVLGIVAETAITVTSHKVKRDKEEELLYRGMAIKNAIASYYQAGKPVKTFPRDLQALVDDSRFAHKRHLRRAYDDPITNDDWETIPAMDGGIAGVFSKSTELTLKQAGFPEQLASFEGSSQYSDWQFEYKPPKKTKGTSAPSVTSSNNIKAE